MSDTDQETFVIRGLHNFGATCYLNSILQMLCNIKGLRSLIREKIQSSSKDDDSNNIANAYERWLSKHIDKEISEGESALALRDFVINFIRYYQNFGSGMQDPHEYLMLLLKVLHDSRSKPCIFNIQGVKSNAIDDLEEMALENLRRDGMWTSFDNLKKQGTGWNSLVFQNFTGQYHSQTGCTAEGCGYVSHRFETFRSMDLDIPEGGKVSIEECLRYTTANTQLDEENIYECDKCKQRSRSTRKTTLWRLPDTLIVCIKRFIAKYDNGQLSLSKNNTGVEVPVSLDLAEYMTFPATAQGHTMYELQSVVHHIGCQQGGHCFTYIRAPDDKWYCVDDANVRQVEESLCGASHYLLCYKKQSK